VEGFGYCVWACVQGLPSAIVFELVDDVPVPDVVLGEDDVEAVSVEAASVLVSAAVLAVVSAAVPFVLSVLVVSAAAVVVPAVVLLSVAALAGVAVRALAPNPVIPITPKAPGTANNLSNLIFIYAPLLK
jgi:hypothetical protein